MVYFLRAKDETADVTDDITIICFILSIHKRYTTASLYLVAHYVNSFILSPVHSCFPFSTDASVPLHHTVQMCLCAAVCILCCNIPSKLNSGPVGMSAFAARGEEREGSDCRVMSGAAAGCMRANECFEAANYSIITFCCSPVRLVFQGGRGGGLSQTGRPSFDQITQSLNIHCKHVCFPGLELGN